MICTRPTKENTIVIRDLQRIVYCLCVLYCIPSESECASVCGSRFTSELMFPSMPQRVHASVIQHGEQLSFIAEANAL